jgi:hypothetical protein
MREQDDPLARRYRELAREEPPAAVDAAILAASRRAVARRSFARRWAAPLSIAAVLVLAIGISLQVERHEPRLEAAAPASVASPPAAAPAPAQESAMLRAQVEAKAKGAPAAAANLDKRAAQAPDPVAQLERIARLRESGEGREADEALAQFRRDFPGYRIPDATWERVRPR